MPGGSSSAAVNTANNSDTRAACQSMAEIVTRVVTAARLAPR
jgi:hypothetical protein